jgi:hypothetical protein
LEQKRNVLGLNAGLLLNEGLDLFEGGVGRAVNIVGDTIEADVDAFRVVCAHVTHDVLRWLVRVTGQQ